MGGSVAVTIREENGNEHRMCRWTNSLPWFVKNVRLLNKDTAHLEKYLSTWRGFRDDWDKNQASGKFEQNMTPVYAPYPFLAPHGYGLVVVDMKENQILDYQCYTSLNTIDVIEVAHDMSAVSPGVHSVVIRGPQPKKLGRQAFYQDEEVSKATRFRELFESGRIKEAKDLRDPNKVLAFLDGKSLDDAINVIENDRERYAFFPIDMVPYQIIKYNESDPEEAQKMLFKIKDLGFKLSQEEESLWGEWIREHSQ